MKKDLLQTFKFLLYIIIFTIYIPVGLLYKITSWSLYKVADFDK